MFKLNVELPTNSYCLFFEPGFIKKTFTNWTIEEFNRLLSNVSNTCDITNNQTNKLLKKFKFGRDILPKVVDWRQQGVVSPVKNQLNYSNSWAFATTGAL